MNIAQLYTYRQVIQTLPACPPVGIPNEVLVMGACLPLGVLAPGKDDVPNPKLVAVAPRPAPAALNDMLPKVAPRWTCCGDITRWVC